MRMKFHVGVLMSCLVIVGGVSGCEETNRETAIDPTGPVSPFGPGFITSSVAVDGRAALGSLDGATTASVTIASSAAPTISDKTVYLAYELHPSGVSFSKGVPFRVRLADLDLKGASADTVQLGFVSGDQIIPLATSYNAEGNYVEASIGHTGTIVLFTPKAVAGGNTVTGDTLPPPPVATPPELTSVVITGKVALAKNYPANLHDLYYASFNAGSKMARGKLFARFCADAACQNPLALVAATVSGADANGNYLYTSGFPKEVTVASAPVGAAFLQWVLDTQYSIDAGKGSCTTVNDCPGDADAVLMSGDTVSTNHDGASTHNPPMGSLPITVTSGPVTLDPAYLGTIYFSGKELWAPPTTEGGKLLVAVSGAGYKNVVRIVDLNTYTHSGYTMKLHESDFSGDLCGFIRTPKAVYAMGTGLYGGYLFAVDPITGQQLHTNATLIPHPQFDPKHPDKPLDAMAYPWPCRGVYVEKGGYKRLYLLQFRGVGKDTTSYPALLYQVDVTNFSADQEGVVSKPFANIAPDRAWRAIDVDGGLDTLVIAEMSWSHANKGGFNQLIRLPLDATGAIANATAKYTDLAVTTTGYLSNEQCGLSYHFPSAVKVVRWKDPKTGVMRNLALMGHDVGIAIYEIKDLASALTAVGKINLESYGRLIMDLKRSPDGKRLYAMPMCGSTEHFTLPAGAGVGNVDKQLIAILDLETTAPLPGIAKTMIDINGDGTPDNGIDMEFHHLKSYIRAFGTSLTLPDIGMTGPQIEVSQKSLFLRGSGIQGSEDGEILSSSGLSQVQDIGVFDLASGKGKIFRQYMPFINGLSADHGAGGGIWGFELSGVTDEASVGGLLYLAPPPATTGSH